MKVAVDRREAIATACDVVAVGLVERGEKDEPLPKTLAGEDAATGRTLAEAWARREVRGKRGEATVFHRTDAKGRLILVGLGPAAEVDPEVVRRAAATAVKALKGRSARTLGFRLSSFVGPKADPEAAARALADGAVLGSYEFLRYKSTKETGVEETSIHLGEAHARAEAALRRAVEQAVEIDEAVLYTRDIANVPPNTATPAWLADEAQRLGKEYGLKVTVFDEKRLAEMHCGGILAVGGGSTRPPRMIVLEYPGSGRSARTIAVVGKGITFDSGGISIKPAPGMSDMKFDKSGACAVLGILRAASSLKVGPRVIGVMACAENLPSGSAYRPGDIVQTYNGKTIDVKNTDAEGRVVLSDALAYVADKFHPDAIIDLATLTGAQVVALGDDMAGLVTPDDALAERILSASAATGEPIWRMPLTDYHRELVKSDVADVRNSTEITVAGMLTAAAFLENFKGPGPWAHLDVAGASWTTPTTRKWQPSYQPIGATGFGVRTIVRYLLDIGR